MSSFKDPSFQDRAVQAAQAKQKALEQLRLRPEPDEKAVAERKAAGVRRETAQTEKREAKRSATEAKAHSKASAAARAAVPLPTETERKAARDARYAARKARK